MLKDYYDKHIVIERNNPTRNGFGGEIPNYTTHIEIDCLIDYIRGQESKIASQYLDKATHILMCDKGQDINESDRVNLNGNYYRILHVDTPFNRHMEILLEYVGVDNV